MFGKLLGKSDPAPKARSAAKKTSRSTSKAQAASAPAGAGSGSGSAGAPATSPAVERPKGRKGVNIKKRFQLVAELQHGSMSKVYRAIDSEAGVVFLKLQDRKLTEAAMARAARGNRPTEGEIGKLIRHPNVCRTLDFGTTAKGDYFLTTEYIEGSSLRYLAQAEGIPLADKLERLAQAADGLAAVHAAGFIHHDIAIKNFLIASPSGTVKLIDFGLAIPDTPEFHKPGNRTGTLNYMAPELVRRKPVDKRIDVFSFGVVMYETLTGKLPYDAVGSMAQLVQRMNGAPTPPESANPRLPEPVCRMIRSLIEPDPARRRASMEGLGDELRALAEQSQSGG